MRVILCSGKGGVGKTSVAAATSVLSAGFGHKTIAFSTDTAHSLSDSFDTSLGPNPTKVLENLWGQELVMSHTLQVHWETVQRWLSALLAWRGMEGIVAEDMAILPGMEELAHLLYIVNYASGKEYDVIVVDCAPTGESLRLLSFPEILHWWVDKMFPIGRTATSILRPLVRPIHIPLPDDDVFESAQHLFDELDNMHHLLTNPDISSIRIVVTPEKMVVKEAQRLFTYLNLYGYSTDLVICNRLIPDEVQDGYFNFWKESQAGYVEVIKESFAPIPISTAPMFSQEVVGIPMLQTMAQSIYGENDPTRFLFKGKAQKLVKQNGDHILILDLPFVGKENISVTRSADELVVHVGAFKRNIILPRVLENLVVKEAKFEGKSLKLTFSPDMVRKNMDKEVKKDVKNH